MRNAIRHHYEQLKQSDYTRWKQFNAALATEDQLDYFKRVLLKKGATPNLHGVPSWVRTCMVNYMPFTHGHFDTNTVPEISVLPAGETAA